ncbi:SRPBCC domain-containing protein [Cellulomonas pakistanensis]|uniref:Activator of HSP90 ATPase n=1 Tax=Cellulomonas pakistanensis TaxID=992287 RepID=A0A919PAP5_9CELL|nr:SRPBCC domain-containing protein [Cellulomonas pakistanensis]GIG37529.1 activator of HSP90 ATPase [Cellulomonas pakistanensis]
MERRDTEPGTIEREIHVAATPEVVYEVVSRPEHLREWWPDDAELGEPVPGAEGEIVFGRRGEPDAVVERLTVVEADPPRTFSFRWTHAPGEAATAATSLLVTFALEGTATGTRVRLTETGFRERGWEVAVLEQRYAEHVEGWDHFVPRLQAYLDRLVLAP